jgi:CRP-like cAMP-binding protein
MKPGLYRSILKQLKEAEYSRKKETIESIGLFQCLTNRQKFSLTHLIKEANFKAGEVIFEAGDVSNGIYIVSEGAVEITLPNKEPLLLTELEVFGESALK